MKKTVFLIIPTIFLVLFLGGIRGIAAEEAFPKEYNTDGTITFEAGDEPTLPVDPENPDPSNPVDPEDLSGSGTGGALSIDYVSRFKFGTQKISTVDKTYYALADVLRDGTKKPTYVQVTDKRGTLMGWKLSINQQEQFATADGEVLEGAQLTFSNASVASEVPDTYKPTIALETFTLNPGAGSQVVVNAIQGTGVGTWVYRFGATTAENQKAVQLLVPGKSVKLAKEYSTKLIWTLGNTP